MDRPFGWSTGKETENSLYLRYPCTVHHCPLCLLPNLKLHRELALNIKPINYFKKPAESLCLRVRNGEWVFEKIA